MQRYKRTVTRAEILAFRGFVWLLFVLAAACAPEGVDGKPDGAETTTAYHAAVLDLPALKELELDGETMRVVATTAIVGDVVSQIAGDGVEVNVLMGPEQDPHGYQSTATDLRMVADAHVIFVNGWGLEEGLIDDLINAAGSAPIVPVSAGLIPRTYDDSGPAVEDHDEALRVDPHVWLVPSNVNHWVNNIERTLTTLDPGHAQEYQEQATRYRAQLGELTDYYEDRLATIPPDIRVLVTNHDAYGYFADAFGFEVIGTVLPGDSTLSEPTSRDLASLVQSMQEASLCSIFVEQGASQDVTNQLANELDHCDEVQIVSLYTGTLGPVGSDADSYLGMMRSNIDLIVGTFQHVQSASGND